MADNVSVLIRSSLLQTLTPAHLLGWSGGQQHLHRQPKESGLRIRRRCPLLGTVPSVVFEDHTLLVVLITAWRVPQLRRLGQIR